MLRLLAIYPNSWSVTSGPCARIGDLCHTPKRLSTASVHATRQAGHRAGDSIAPDALVPNSFRTRGFSSSPRLRTRRVQVKREWRRGLTASTATWRYVVDPGNRVVALRGVATRRRSRRCQRPPLLGKVARRKDRPPGLLFIKTLARRRSPSNG